MFDCFLIILSSGGTLRDPISTCSCERSSQSDRETAAFFNVYKASVESAYSDRLMTRYDIIPKPGSLPVTLTFDLKVCRGKMSGRGCRAKSVRVPGKRCRGKDVGERMSGKECQDVGERMSGRGCRGEDVGERVSGCRGEGPQDTEP